MTYFIFFHRIHRFSCQNVHYTFLKASCDIFLPHFQALLSVIVQGIYYSRFKAAETEVITARFKVWPWEIKCIRAFPAQPVYMRTAGIRQPDDSCHFVICLSDSIIPRFPDDFRSEEHTSELQSRFDLVCRLLLEK